MGPRFDVVCSSVGGRDLHVDIYEPSGSVNHRTAILVHHGGGWAIGDRKRMQPRCEVLAGRGFTVLAVEYRLIGEAPWPAQLDDVNAAVAWTWDHAAELGIDADRIVVEGHSAGAHLALMAAGTRGRSGLGFDTGMAPIAAVIAYYPPVQLNMALPAPDASNGLDPVELAASRGADGSVPAAMLLGSSASAERAAAASPLTYADAEFPPTLMFHGTIDGFVAPRGSERFSSALRAAGVPCELHLVAEVDHEFDSIPRMADLCSTIVENFLSRQMIEPARYADDEAEHVPMVVAMRRGTRFGGPGGP